jgi:hypothetical protein
MGIDIWFNNDKILLDARRLGSINTIPDLNNEERAVLGLQS